MLQALEAQTVTVVVMDLIHELEHQKKVTTSTPEEQTGRFKEEANTCFHAHEHMKGMDRVCHVSTKEKLKDEHSKGANTHPETLAEACQSQMKCWTEKKLATMMTNQVVVESISSMITKETKMMKMMIGLRVQPVTIVARKATSSNHNVKNDMKKWLKQ